MIGLLMRWISGLAILLCLLGATEPANKTLAARIAILNAATIEAEGALKLNAEIALGLSKPVRKALRNGVPLSFDLIVEISKPQSWWWDQSIAQVTRRFRLEYHELSQQYVIEDRHGGTQRVISDQDTALKELGTIRNMNILRTEKLYPDVKYRARARAELVVDEIPLPLRASSYLSSDWHMQSDWYTWALR